MRAVRVDVGPSLWIASARGRNARGHFGGGYYRVAPVQTTDNRSAELTGARAPFRHDYLLIRQICVSVISRASSSGTMSRPTSAPGSAWARRARSGATTLPIFG